MSPTVPPVELVDSRIRVWWTEENAWYAGRVVSVERSAGGSLHTTVAYDDNSIETHDLESETWETWEEAEAQAQAVGAGTEAQEPSSSSSSTAESAGRLSLADQRKLQREREAYAAADAVGDELLQQHVRIYWTCERRWFRGACDATCYEDERRLHHISYEDGSAAWHHLPSECWMHAQSPARREPPARKLLPRKLLPPAKSPLRPRGGAKSSRRTKGRGAADTGGSDLPCGEIHIDIQRARLTAASAELLAPPAASEPADAAPSIGGPFALLELPAELITHALHFLTAVELARVRAVSRTFMHVHAPAAARLLAGVLFSCPSPPRKPPKLSLPRLQDACDWARGLLLPGRYEFTSFVTDSHHTVHYRGEGHLLLRPDFTCTGSDTITSTCSGSDTSTLRCAITTGYWTRAGLITYTLPYGQHPRTLYKYELSLVADREGRAFAKRDQALSFSGQWEIDSMQGVEAENTAYNVGCCTCDFTRKWKNLAGVP